MLAEVLALRHEVAVAISAQGTGTTITLDDGPILARLVPPREKGTAILGAITEPDQPTRHERCSIP